MRVAVISDIHANLYALEAVLAEIDRDPPDAIWCLGDVIGYGPRPNECVEIVADRAAVCLIGNHDLVALGDAKVELSEFNEEAAAAARWTASELTSAAREFLRGLAPQARMNDVGLYHGSPADPVWAYVLTIPDAIAAFQLAHETVVLVGHSHVALAVTLTGGNVAGGLAPDGTQVGLASDRWLLNPGSVGQPRDGDPRAAYLLLELEGRFATFHRVQYPVEKTQHELRERGLPPPLAARLAYGQ